MQKPTYFILNEADGDRRHIGTVVASNDEELTAKVTEALEAHFDYEVKEIKPFSMDDVRNTHSGSFEFEVLVNSELYDDDVIIGIDDDDRRQIEIIETWLY
ncbi:MAG TPA: hypothetical protein DCL77_14680 [Prolixibacteraceae bacterium]|jgi:hypothetical protein|nr:hypothetical protein [Prolixibacteraceae bacterium]